MAVVAEVWSATVVGLWREVVVVDLLLQVVAVVVSVVDGLAGTAMADS